MLIYCEKTATYTLENMVVKFFELFESICIPVFKLFNVANPSKIKVCNEGEICSCTRLKPNILTHLCVCIERSFPAA